MSIFSLRWLYRGADSQGLFINSSVTSINFHPLQPHHFTASFANGTFMQFNLFAEDPAVTINTSAMPWEAVMEVHDYQVAQGAEGSKRTSNAGAGEANGSATGSDGAAKADEEAKKQDSAQAQFEDRMTLWKNEDWAQLKDRAANRKKGPEDALSPWAGKNPVAVYKIGAKPAKCELRNRPAIQ